MKQIWFSAGPWNGVCRLFWDKTRQLENVSPEINEAYFVEEDFHDYSLEYTLLDKKTSIAFCHVIMDQNRAWNSHSLLLQSPYHHFRNFVV